MEISQSDQSNPKDAEEKKRTLWDEVKRRFENHRLGVVVLCAVALMTFVLLVEKVIKILPWRAPEPIVNVNPSCSPLNSFAEGRHPDGKRLFSHGFRPEFTLTHKNLSPNDSPIAVKNMLLNFEFTPGSIAEFRYQKSVDGLSGLGGKPNEFTVHLDGNRIDRAEWFLPETKEKYFRPKSNDLFDVKGFPRPSLGPGKHENIDPLFTIKGTVLAEETGLYKVWFTFRTANPPRAYDTNPVYFYYEE